MSEQPERPERQPEPLSPSESAVIDSVLMSPSEWAASWAKINADSPNLNAVDPADLLKEAGAARAAGHFDQAAEQYIRAQFPQTTTPRQPRFSDLNDRGKRALLARGLERQMERQKPR